MAYILSPEKAELAIEKIREAIRRYFVENHLTYAVFGKSEGLDSSVIAGLLSHIEGVKPIAVLLPIESHPEPERIGRLVLQHFGIPFLKVDLTREYHALLGNFFAAGSLQEQLGAILQGYGDKQVLQNMASARARALGNIKARLRMITLYHIAQLTGGIVISTDNLSELWMGFWTLNGDVGDLAPIQHVWKGLEEPALAEVLGVPSESLNVVPTDGLEVVPGGTDEDQLGLSYAHLDRVTVRLLQNKFDGDNCWKKEEARELFDRIARELGHVPSAVAHVAEQLQRTRYKRCWPRVLIRKDIGLLPVELLEVI